MAFPFYLAPILAFIVALAGTLLLERHGGMLGLVQAPNHRSSHTRPTPRGGGVAVAAAMVLVSGLLSWSHGAMFGYASLAIAALAILGFVDDLRGLSALLRLGIQFIVVVALTLVLLPPPDLFGASIADAALACCLVVAGVWWINLFNFMDGIDGLAATQAPLVVIGALLIWTTSDAAAPISPTLWYGLAIGTASLGFLLRNLPPARIFMGDSGSNGLAIAIMALALMTTSSGGISSAAWVILSGTLIADASLTLVRRISRGEKPWEAHRRHAYQQLARRYGHGAVTTGYGLVTVIWLMPLALVAQHFSGIAWLIVLLAYCPLLAGALVAGGGNRTEIPPPR